MDSQPYAEDDGLWKESITTNPNTGRQYKTISTKVRNYIDHPNTAPAYTPDEIEESIKLMRAILINVPKQTLEKERLWQFCGYVFWPQWGHKTV